MFKGSDWQYPGSTWFVREFLPHAVFLISLELRACECVCKREGGRGEKGESPRTGKRTQMLQGV